MVYAFCSMALNLVTKAVNWEESKRKSSMKHFSPVYGSEMNFLSNWLMIYLGISLWIRVEMVERKLNSNRVLLMLEFYYSLVVLALCFSCVTWSSLLLVKWTASKSTCSRKSTALLQIALIGTLNNCQTLQTILLALILSWYALLCTKQFNKSSA